MKKKYKYLVVVPVILLCTLFGCQGGKQELQFENVEGTTGEITDSTVGTETAESSETAETLESAGNSTEEGKEDSPCVVYVCGAVQQPGVYELPSDGRIYQAIEQAGGLSSDADPNYLNQAGFVSDGEKIYVPTRDEVLEMDSVSETGSGETGNTGEDSGLINLNTASEDQLCTIPGIGSSKARSILDYRDEHGGFQKIEDVMNVAGIKEGLFEKMKAYITV